MYPQDSFLSIYIHVPFCATKCTYCAFNTYVNLDRLVEPFTKALVQEIQIVGVSKPNQAVGTIFFGGGTPSLLSPAQIDTILNAVSDYFHVLPGAEITIEANPADLNRDYLTALHQVGVNRLSIGMQSANANELALFDRRHDNDAVAHAVSAARHAGYDNINLDLIYGVPHQTLGSWENSLQQMLFLQPEHISLYALGLEEGTALHSWVTTGRLPAPDDDLAADMYELATDLLAKAGYEQYEISNWSKPGHQCRHNLQYWYNLPYVGLGPGAHGYADNVRYSVILSPQRYIKALENVHEKFVFPRTPVTDQAVDVDRESEIAETLIMGLRLLQEGIPRPQFAQRFGEDLLAIHGTIIDRFEKRGLLEVTSERVRLTKQGRLLSNMVFRELV